MLFEVGRALDVAGLPTIVFWFRYLQGLSNFFGSCSGYPLLWYPTVAPEPRGGVSTLPEVLTRLGSQQLLSGLCSVLEAPVGAHKRTHRV